MKQLKSLFTSYWRFLIVHTAAQIDLFDFLERAPASIEEIIEKLNVNEVVLKHLLQSLERLQLIHCKNGKWYNTDLGSYLTESHPNSYKQACILWGQEHLTAWQHLLYTLKTGKPAFEMLYKQPYFNYLRNHPKKLKNYHKAMAEYARDDYNLLPQAMDFSEYQSIADVGGGTGVLISYIAQSYPHLKCFLIDLPEVLRLIEEKLPKNVSMIAANFFHPLPIKVDAIILSRVLHDWDDVHAVKILENCYNAMNDKADLIIIEALQDKIATPELSLNMQVMCGSYERTSKEYEHLLSRTGFILKTIKPYKEHHYILIAKKVLL